MADAWLRCIVFKGMFSDEVAIRYVRGSQEWAYFVPKVKVRQRNGEQGEVSVRSFVRSGKTWAILPTENQAAIPIDEGDLVAT